METKKVDPALTTATILCEKKMRTSTIIARDTFIYLYYCKRSNRTSQIFFSEKPTQGHLFYCTSFHCFRNMFKSKLSLHSMQTEIKIKCLQNAVNSIHTKITKTHKIVGFSVRRVLNFSFHFRQMYFRVQIKLSNRRNAKTRSCSQLGATQSRQASLYSPLSFLVWQKLRTGMFPARWGKSETSTYVFLIIWNHDHI